jgi:anti-anti-sigma factor
MSMQIWPEGVVLVELPGEPGMSEELDSVAGFVKERGDCDVVLDFGKATIVTSTSLASLLRLRDLVGTGGRRLLLCNVDDATKGVFSVTALDDVFEIVKSRIDAFATVHAAPDSETTCETSGPPCAG